MYMYMYISVIIIFTWTQVCFKLEEIEAVEKKSKKFCICTNTYKSVLVGYVIC